MKLFNFFKQRWFISLLGVIAIALLIWFLGPFIAFNAYEPLGPETHRWILIGIGAAYWLVARIWTYVASKKRNDQVLTAMSVSNEPALSADQMASRDELQAIKERMEDALKILKKSQLGSHFGRQFLYQLPWYIIIGPPGSGKSTLLKNSDLKFPLSDRFGKDAIRGVGGTRNCDWWFTDEAVLLDTAGRYTTQDSHEKADQLAWLGFLDLLKKHRSRRPINGAIIAISITDLLEQSKAEQHAHAVSIRNRIQELHERFNIRFPVYVLFTKCDLLAGFIEYFDDLDNDKRGQVWGTTFKLEEDTKANSVEQFTQEFNLLGKQLQNQLVDKLQREQGGNRRNLIYTFPQQFSSLGELAQSFLSEIFQTTRYEHATLLRGVYFTSATQEGSPIDRIMGFLANSFGLDRQNLPNTHNQGKSFFINRLLSHVIFAEHGLAGTNLKLESKRAWLQRGAFVSIAALSLLVASIWLYSYVGNKAYIQEVTEQVKGLQQDVNRLNPDETDPLPLLPLLDKVRNLPGGYSDQQEGTPWGLGFGLYQGDKLGNASVSLYQKLLKDVFLPRLLSRLEQQLQNNSNNSDYLLETLKVYLMFNDEKNYNKDAITAWLTLDWTHNLPLDVPNEQRQALISHLNILLATRPAPLPRPLNQTLISQTRSILENTPIAQRVYARMKLELANSGATDFAVSEKAGRDAPLVLANKSGDPLTRGVSGFFTCAGYKDVFLKNNTQLIDQQVADNWVLGSIEAVKLSDAETKALRENVLKQYLNDYIKQWDDLLADIQLKPFSSQTQMVEVLNIVAGENSPLKLLLQAVDDETSFACLAEKNKNLLDKASSKITSAGNMLEKIISSTPDAHSAAPPEITTNLVTEHFRELHELVQGKPGGQPPLNQSLAVLNELYVYLNSLLHASGEELATEQRKQSLEIIDKVKLEGKRNPFPLKDMLNTIAADSNDLVSGGVKKHYNNMWRSTVLPFCNKAVQGLYPMYKSSREITYEDFTAFFGPAGLMDDFFTKYLAASVEKGTKNWTWNTRGAADPAISVDALAQFQLADTIKNIFFRMGKQSPAVSFKLKPISMSTEISTFVLDVDGQRLTYDHGPVRPVSMKWPGPNNAGQVSIEMLPPTHGSSGLSKVGPWALFRVFDEAQISRTSDPTMFIMTFNIEGREAKFELRADSAINPFQLSDLAAFRCLPNL
jgi:type VI secretion system protein ImpL